MIKKIFFLIFTGTVFILFSFKSASAQYPAQIRFMTYNINAAGHGDGPYDDIAAVINELSPKITGLQKIDSCNSRNPQFVAQLLGEQTNRKYTFAPAIENYQNSSGSYGVAFLTVEEPLSVRRLHIEPTANEEGRGVLETVITMGGEAIRVVVTHLAHEGVSYRESQVEKILSWLGDSATPETPTIIMADFNAKPTESSLQLFTDAGFSFVKGLDGTILDTTNNGINHIIYRPSDRWNIIDAGNPHYDASNRNPVWADMELLNPVVAVKPALKETNSHQVALLPSDNGFISYILSEPSMVSFNLFRTDGKLAGRLCTDMIQQAGTHRIHLQKNTVAAGVYLGRLSAGGTTHVIPVHVP